MNRKKREFIRAIANGEVYRRPRKPAIPSPKIYQLKNRYRRCKKISEVDFDDQ